MINALIIIGIFATLAMILAGGKIILQLSSKKQLFDKKFLYIVNKLKNKNK